MTVTSTILQNITAAEYYAGIQKVEDKLDELKSKFEPKLPNEYLTRSEVAKLLKCDLSTIHNWTKAGKLRAYAIGARVLYKRSEIDSALIPLKQNKK